MYYYHPILGGFFNFIFFLIILFLVWKFLAGHGTTSNNMYVRRGNRREDETLSAYELLRERFVRGEIDEREFEYKLGVLERCDDRLSRRKN